MDHFHSSLWRRLRLSLPNIILNEIGNSGVVEEILINSYVKSKRYCHLRVVQFLNGYFVALQSKLPFQVALLQVLQTGKQSTMLLKILCCIYYVNLYTISSVKDYKSQDFLSKIVSSIISDTMLLVIDGNICFCQDMDRWCAICFIKYPVWIAYTRSFVYSRKLSSIGQG